MQPHEADRGENEKKGNDRRQEAVGDPEELPGVAADVRRVGRLDQDDRGEQQLSGRDTAEAHSEGGGREYERGEQRAHADGRDRCAAA